MVSGFDRRYGTVAVVALAGMAALIVLCLRTAGQLRENAADLDRARDVQQLTHSVTRTLLDLESGWRRSPQNPEAVNVEPRQADLERLDAQLGNLTAATSDWPDEAADLRRLRELMDARRAELAGTTAAAGATPGAVPDDPGTLLTGQIRHILAHLDALESATQAQRRAARSASIERNQKLVILLAAAISLLLAALFVLMRRDRTLQQRVLHIEATARQSLAEQVKERTDELQVALHSLALSEGRLRGVFESAIDGILTVDESQVIVQANPASARLFRCTAAEMVGMPLERLIPARYRENHRQHLLAFGAGDQDARRMCGSDGTREVMGLRLDGEVFPIEAGISHVEVGGQRLYTVILRDISRRRQGEAALRESKARLEAALASMNDAVFITDAQGRFVEYNDAFVSFNRFGSRNECGRTLAEYAQILDIFMADGTPAPLEQWAAPRALRGETAANVEYTLRRKDSGQSWVGSFSFAPIRAGDDSIIGSVVTGRDITHIKKTQADLAASHAALQHLITNQQHVQEDERKRIARELHDDLQQSLAAIRMDAVAIGERLAKGRGDVQDMLARIDRLLAAAIASTRRIVNDLRPEVLEDLGLVPALESMCAQYAQRMAIECRFEASAAAIDAAIDGAAIATGLYRITQEALNNVAKHAKATAVRVRLDCTHDGLVMLRVSDNGIGMHRRETRPSASFGLLGMAERVRALGGQLRIESQADSGTMIEVLVPSFAPNAADGVVPGESGPVPLAGNHVERQLPGPQDVGGHPLQSVIDALAGNVAVLDSDGVVQLVNRAWRRSAARNGDPRLQRCGPGANYLEVCRRSAASDPSALPVLHGLSAVLEGRDEAFVFEYPCDMPGGRRWFRLHAALITGGLAIVTHCDIGDGHDQVASTD